MIQLRKSGDRGHALHGWLEARHSFSFADYYDPQHRGFRVLRVINEDRVAPGGGFSTHAHKDMEIVTYVLAGALEHKDSMGNGSIIKAGDIQYMSAGSGVEHSEFNPSTSEGVHLLQIWLYPNEKDAVPRYSQRFAPHAEKRDRALLLVSGNGESGSIAIRQDAKIYASVLSSDKQFDLALAKGRYAWIQMARGAIELNGVSLTAGDGAAVSETEKLTFLAREESEFLIFDLP